MPRNRNITATLAIALLRLLARLPLRLLYVVSDIAFILIYKVIRYRRKVVRGNLRMAFPEKTDTERRDIEHRFYHQLCDVMVETVKLLHISDEEMLHRVTVEGAHLIEEAATRGQPVFLLLGHCGNWEWAQEIKRHISQPEVCGEIYRPLASPVGDAVMRAVRSRYSTLLIPQSKAVRTIIRMKQEHPSYLIGFIADQRPTFRAP